MSKTPLHETTVESWLKSQRELLDAATPGPWKSDGHGDVDGPDGSLVVSGCMDDTGEEWAKTSDIRFIASVRTEHERALKIIEKYREALEYYAKQVEPELEKNYVSALAFMHDMEHINRIQKIKLPATEALEYIPASVETSVETGES